MDIKFGLVANTCSLLEESFLLSGAPLSAGRFSGRKCVSYLFLHSEGNELDLVLSRFTHHRPLSVLLYLALMVLVCESFMMSVIPKGNARS